MPSSRTRPSEGSTEALFPPLITSHHVGLEEVEAGRLHRADSEHVGRLQKLLDVLENRRAVANAGSVLLQIQSN